MGDGTMSDMTGKILGNRYEILKKIGTGGMADVYLARCNLLNRNVAIKVLKSEFSSDEEFIKKFNIESQAAASLSHPNIVSIYDVGHEGDIHYIVMEYLEGITLKKYIEQNKLLPWREVLNFSIQICSAIECAHKNNIVHRDIKPQNIMFTSDGILKVTDFGIAHRINGDMTMKKNETMGSVHYIAPEQAKGSYVDERTDVYSIGVVMYEMMTGKTPFDSDNAVSIAIMHMQKDPVPPREINITIPMSMEAVCLKAIAEEPANRYQSVTEMLQALNDIRDGEPDIPSKPENAVLADTQATRVINTKDIKEQASEIEPPAEEKKELDELDALKALDDIEDEEEKEPEVVDEATKKKRKKQEKIALISAIAASLVIVSIFTVFMINLLDPSLLSGLFKSNKVEVPDLVGKVYTEVVAEYENNEDYKIELEEEVYDETVEEGKIISQDPKAKTKKKKPVTIKVKVSLGQDTGEMPDFVDKSESVATAFFDKNNITYEVTKEYSDDVPEGYIIKTTPKAGEKIDKDDTVTIVVSRGSEDKKAVVPNLIGLSESEAKSKVQQRNLTWGDVKYVESDKAKGTVVSQSIGADSSVAEKTKIDVTISDGSLRETPTPTPTQKPTEKPQTTPEPEQPKVSQNITLNLPGDRDSVRVTLVIDGAVVHDKTYDTSEGTVAIKLTSSGKKTVQVKYDGVLVDTREINFV